MADTENVSIPITIPAINFEQAVVQAVVDSKMGELIQSAIANFLGNQYQLQEDIRKEVRAVVSQEIRKALGTEWDPKLKEQVSSPAAQRLRKMIVAEVEKTLTEPEALSKLVNNVIGRGF